MLKEREQPTFAARRTRVYGAPGHRLPLTCNVTAPRGRVGLAWDADGA